MKIAVKLIGIVLITTLVWVSYSHWVTVKNRSTQTVDMIDTVHVTDTVYIEKSVKDEPIQYSKFHISDRVCAWGRIQGVVTDIRQNKKDPKVLIYTVQIIDLNTMEFDEGEFYDTELQAGDCIN